MNAITQITGKSSTNNSTKRCIKCEELKKTNRLEEQEGFIVVMKCLNADSQNRPTAIKLVDTSVWQN